MNPENPEHTGAPASRAVLSGCPGGPLFANLLAVVVTCLFLSGGSTPARPPEGRDPGPHLLPAPTSMNRGAILHDLTEAPDKPKQWRIAVGQHEPGQFDEAASAIAGWSYRDLLNVVATIKKDVRRVLADSPSRGVDSPQPGRPGLTGDENRILKRGALLHTDIALLAPETTSVVQPYGGPTQLRVIDGRSFGHSGGAHWQIARELLDLVRPQPSSDAMVHQWYMATTSLMQSTFQWGTAELNLSRAQEIFPSDAGIQFLSGALHENYSMPFAQNALPPPGTRFDIGSEKTELQLARRFFERAIRADPAFSEAHLRLGRVLGRLGYHDEAVAELEKADAVVTDPQLQYYVGLFLGHEREMLGQIESAREQFERATKLCPDAQSPLLALSQIARRTGNSPGALAAMETALTLRAKDDPWWTYQVAHVRNAAALIEEIRQTFGGLPR